MLPVSRPARWGLVKLGANTLTLASSNNYTGVTTIHAGVLSLAATDTNTALALGGGPLGTVLLNAPNTIVFGGGTLQYSSATRADYSGRFSTAAGQPIVIDTNGQSVTFAAPLSSADGSLTLNDSNGVPGRLILAASNTYSGVTTISRGILSLGYADSNGMSVLGSGPLGSVLLSAPTPSASAAARCNTRLPTTRLFRPLSTAAQAIRSTPTARA